MPGATTPIRVSLVAFPDTVLSVLTGVYDVLNAFRILRGFDPSIPSTPPFRVEIVAETAGEVMVAGGVPVQAKRRIGDVPHTDIVIAPAVLLFEDRWEKGRYPALTDWCTRMHEGGATLCSACSGIFLLAETGLFEGRETTLHWIYERAFREAFPGVPCDPERVLVISGDREDLVTSGAAMMWHDLVLYLISRHVGSAAAQAVARFFALQWHHEGIGAYVVFHGRIDHDDADIRRVQHWIAENAPVARPVEEMIGRSGLSARTFKRRFKLATGLPPLDYVQRLRVETAKRLLEQSQLPVDDISWQVGYEDPAFFRRLFRRLTGLPPGLYRKRFRIPEFAEPALDAARRPH